MVVERPLLHVADLFGRDPIDDEGWVVDRAQVVAKQGVGIPDFLEQGPVGDDLRHARDPDLVVVIVEVAEFDARVGGDLERLVVGAEVGDVDGESVGPDRRDGPDPGSVAINRGQVRESVCSR